MASGGQEGRADSNTSWWWRSWRCGRQHKLAVGTEIARIAHAAETARRD